HYYMLATLRLDTWIYNPFTDLFKLHTNRLIDYITTFWLIHVFILALNILFFFLFFCFFVTETKKCIIDNIVLYIEVLWDPLHNFAHDKFLLYLKKIKTIAVAHQFEPPTRTYISP
ncbi:hypothetical protein ACJX0J_012124, partial [Zea mays]